MARQNESMASYAQNLDNKYGFPLGTMETLVRTESNGKGDATSSKGARGYTQLMPSAMTDAGLHGVDPASLPYRQQLSIAAAHLNRGMEKFGDIGMALAGYNAGNGRMSAVRSGKTILPNETAKYLQKFSDAGIIPPDSEALQYAQSARRAGRHNYQQPDFSDVDNAISAIGDTSAWEAKRAQFSNQRAGRPTVSTWEERRAQFLAKNTGIEEQQPEIAQSNLNPEMNYFSSGQRASLSDNQRQSTSQQIGNGLAETGRGLLQAAINVGNIPASITDAVVGAGAGIGQMLGMGDGTYLTAPRVTTQGLEQDFGLKPGTLTPQSTEGKIFSEVLPYLTPVGAERLASQSPNLIARAAQAIPRLTAENVTGALAANSGPDASANGFATDLALGIGAGGVINTAAKGIGRGIAAIKGEIAPDAQKLLTQASATDVPVMTSDVIKPNTKTGNQLQDYSEGVIFGTGPMRASQQEARTRLINNFADRYGDYDPATIVQSAKSGVAREQKLASSKLNAVSTRMAGKKIDTSGTERAIDGAVKELGRLKGVSDTQTISALNDYKKAIQETSGGDDAFELLDRLRTQFRIDVKGDRHVLPPQSQSITDRVYNSLTNSLNKSIAKSLSPKDAAAWRSGKADYAKMAADITQTRLKNVLNKGLLTPEAVNTIVYGQAGSDIARLYGKLDSKGKDMLRTAYISRIASKVGDSPQRMMTELEKLSKQANGQVFKTVFSGKHKKELEGLMAVLNATSRASKANVVTPTGMTVSAPLRVLGNITTGGGLMAGEAGIGLLSRIYESPAVRNYLLRLANTKAGTTGYEKALNQAVLAIRPLMVNQAQNQ